VDQLLEYEENQQPWHVKQANKDVLMAVQSKKVSEIYPGKSDSSSHQVPNPKKVLQTFQNWLNRAYIFQF